MQAAPERRAALRDAMPVRGRRRFLLKFGLAWSAFVGGGAWLATTLVSESADGFMLWLLPMVGVVTFVGGCFVGDALWKARERARLERLGLAEPLRWTASSTRRIALAFAPALLFLFFWVAERERDGTGWINLAIAIAIVVVQSALLLFERRMVRRQETDKAAAADATESLVTRNVDPSPPTTP